MNFYASLFQLPQCQGREVIDFVFVRLWGKGSNLQNSIGISRWSKDGFMVRQLIIISKSTFEHLWKK